MNIMVATGIRDETFMDQVEVVDMRDLRYCPNGVSSYPLAVELAVGLKHDSKFVVCGGWDGFDPHSDCYGYSNGTNTWDLEAFRLEPARLAMMSVEIRANEWLVMGGAPTGSIPFTPYSDTKLLSHGIFIEGPTLPEPIYGGSAAMLNQTHLFVAGGYDGNVYSKNNYLLNIDTNQWAQIASRNLVTERYHMSGTFYNSSSDEVQVANIGLNGIEVYSPKDDSWSSELSFPSPISYLYRSVAIQQGFDSFILVGGETDLENYTPAISTDSMKMDFGRFKKMLWPFRGKFTRPWRFQRAISRVPKIN